LKLAFRCSLVAAWCWLFAACAPKVTIRPAREGVVGSIRAADIVRLPWQMVRAGEFSRAEKALAAMPLDTSVLIMAAQGMLDLKQGKYAQAEEKLRRVVHARADSSVRRFAYYGLQSILVMQERFLPLESLEGLAQRDQLTSDSTSLLAAEMLRLVGPLSVEARQPVTRVAMKKTIAHCPAATVEVNGPNRADFWFDTGASLSVISEDLARRYQVRMLSERPGYAGTATERKVQFRFGVIDSLAIGSMRVRNVLVAVMRRSDLSMGIPFLKIPGILGWPVIARFRTTFDYPARQIRLELPAPDRAGNRRNLDFFGVPMVEVAVDATGPLHFIFDTGAIGSMITESGLDKFVHPPQVASGPGCIGGAGGHDVGKVQVVWGASLTLDRQTAYPILLHLQKLPTEELPISPDGLVGEDVLKNFVVTIDAHKGIVTLAE
jgi:hypothetical protein